MTAAMPAATQRAHFKPSWRGDCFAAINAVAKRPLGADAVRAIDMNFQWDGREAWNIHWPDPLRNNYRFVVDGDRVRRMTRAELRRPVSQWSDGASRWRRGPSATSTRPHTYAECVAYAVKRGVVICAELKSAGFATDKAARHVVDAAKAAGHPAWFMALINMKDCRGKAEAIVRAGGEFAVIFGKFRRLARKPPADWADWDPKPTRLWGPAKWPLDQKPEPAVSTVDQIIQLAKAEVGYHEGRSNGHWNNRQKYSAAVHGLEWSDGQPWCATFNSWLDLQAGLRPDIDFPVTASCDVAGAWFKKQGRWSEYPGLGAWVLFGSPRDLNHTGRVIAFDADTITTIEGNTNDSGSREGDGVYVKTHRRRDVHVVGYGYPKFSQPIVSADPAWQRPVENGVTPRPIDGVDGSHHNKGRIDWPKAIAGGLKFFYHKATEGTGFRDDMYASRRAEARAFKVPFGGYHFARPAASSGAAQARFFLAVAKPRKKFLGLRDLRPMLDLEDRGGLTDEQLTQWVEDFVREVKRQGFKPPVLYTPFNLTRDPGCFLWVARYNNQNAEPAVPRPWKTWTIDQFSNGVAGVPNRVPGFPFAVDINSLAPGFNLNRLKL